MIALALILLEITYIMPVCYLVGWSQAGTCYVLIGILLAAGTRDQGLYALRCIYRGGVERGLGFTAYSALLRMVEGH